VIETTRSFTPDWVSPSGDGIADFLEERDWTQAQERRTFGLYRKAYQLAH
jgi:HTH-type transcriptional regulator / antitoxin HigA